MKFVPKGITQTVCRQVLVAKKNSPHIFFIGGLVGVVGSTFLACRATLKLEDTIDEIKHDLDVVSANKIEKENKEQAKDIGYVCVKSAVAIGRLYGPSVALGTVSVVALTGSHVQLTRRNTALTATLALVSKAYDEYRIRVQEEIGKDRELDIHRSIKTQELEVDGKKKLVKVIDPNGLSQYARIFDETTPNWVKDVEYNRIFLDCQQAYFNQKLLARGHVFLNEIYDALGFERTRAGAIVGWVIDEGKDSDSDNYIDFGMFVPDNSRFINGYERSIVLDFNVDGVVYDKI